MSSGITIVGLGPGGKDTLPPVNLKALKGAEKLFLRTRVHPVVTWISEQQISFKSFDKYYEEAESFEEVYSFIARDVLAAGGVGPVVYAVPGHPMVAEAAVEIIMREARRSGLPIKVLPAMSFLDAIYAALEVDPVRGLRVIDGLELDKATLDPAVGAVVVQIYSRLVASDAKIALLEVYPPEHRVALVRAAGVPGEERIQFISLHEIDRWEWIDHLTSLYLPPVEGPVAGSGRYPMDELVNIMARLRADNGCPWDREQDHHSLTPYLLEETYEVLEAIQQEEMYKICEELGDLLLQIVFHAQIAREQGYFDINDVVDGINRKMVRRHPHVFGNVNVRNSDEVLANWEKIKKSEKDGDMNKNESLLAGIPRGLPSLLRSFKIQAKAARVGFDWPDYRGALDKVAEEVEEWKEALKNGRRHDIEQETGDVLFAVVNVARLLGIDPETALYSTTEKFCRRFEYIEQQASFTGKNLAEMTLNEMNKLWEQAKKDENVVKNAGKIYFKEGT